MKRQRRKYSRPIHPWESDRMDAEDRLLQHYGLYRKEEIWRTQTFLRGVRHQARRLLAASGPQAEREKMQLLTRMHHLGLVKEGATPDDVLAITLEEVLERRLQTLVFRKGFARTMKEARQLITHGHILVGGRKLSAPSYLTSPFEENLISSSITFKPAEGPAPQPQPEGPEAQIPVERGETQPASESQPEEKGEEVEA